MEAAGERRTFLHIWILWPGRDTSSDWRPWTDRGINWEELCFLVSCHSAHWCMWEWTKLFTENSAPPSVCILDLGCTRAVGSRKAVESFCRYVDSHGNSGLWYVSQPTSSRSFFANSQPKKCAEKLVISMYDHGWNTQFREFDIVEEVMSQCWCHLHRWETWSYPIWTRSRQSLLVLCTCWQEKNGPEDSHSYSYYSGLARCCTVHESSAFQDATRQKFLLTTWSFWLQSDCCQASFSTWRRSFDECIFTWMTGVVAM